MILDQTPRLPQRTIRVPRPSLERTVLEVLNRLGQMPRDARVEALLVRATQCRNALEAWTRRGFDDELCRLLATKVDALEAECFALYEHEPVSVAFFRR